MRGIERRIAAFAVADAWDRPRGVLGFGRQGAQYLGRRLASGVEQIEITQRSTVEKIGRGKPGKRIFRREPRHGDRALDQRIKCCAVAVRSGHGCRTVSDENLNADVGRFRSFGILQHPEPDADPRRHHGANARLGRVGARGECAGDGVLGTIDQRGYRGETFRHPPQIGRARRRVKAMAETSAKGPR